MKTYAQLWLAFDEAALLNKTVEEIDEERLTGHVRKLFALFLEKLPHGGIVDSNKIAREGGGQQNWRLGELRLFLITQGLCIDHIDRKHPDFRPEWIIEGKGQAVHYYKIVLLKDSVYFKERCEKLGHLAPPGFEFEI